MASKLRQMARQGQQSPPNIMIDTAAVHAVSERVTAGLDAAHRALEKAADREHQNVGALAQTLTQVLTSIQMAFNQINQVHEKLIVAMNRPMQAPVVNPTIEVNQGGYGARRCDIERDDDGMITAITVYEMED